MNQSAPKLTTLKQELGIDRATRDLGTLVSLGTTIVTNAPHGAKPCCAWDAGSLSRRLASEDSAHFHTLLFDMGGTHTKVATKNNKGEWHLLFDHLNDWFEPKRDNSLPLLQGFFRVLIQEVLATMPQLKGSQIPLRIGVIWSNQIKTKRFSSSGTRGVTGIVHGFQSGGYRKGEWFLKGLSNGDDIGDLFVKEFTHAGVTPERLVIGNDTLFTLFAVPGAHAGVVMSSGGNCTLVGTSDSERDELYNSELGGMFMLPREILSLGDITFAQNRGLSSLSLEELSAGNWFPGMVTAHITAAATLAQGESLIPVTAALKNGSLTITNRALCNLVSGEGEHFPSLAPASLKTLRELVVALIARGAYLAGVMTYLSVVGQLRAGARSVTISLDSSMARYFPLYFDTMKRCISDITPSGCTIDVVLVHPIQLSGGGDISVPLQGAARAISSN